MRSARRIQPGGAPAGPGHSADPPACPFPSRGGRPGGGDAARTAPGPRRAHFLRGGAPRPAPGRLGRPRGSGEGGRPPPRGRRYSPPPGSSTRRHPGPRETTASAASLPRNRPVPPPPGGAGRGAGKGDGAPRSRRGCQTGRTALSAPQPRRAAEAGGPAGAARGPRRCRCPTRPVLKHGPRSLTRARVGGTLRETLWRNEGEGRGAPAEVGSRRPPLRRGGPGGRTTGPSRPHRRGGGA